MRFQRLPVKVDNVRLADVAANRAGIDSQALGALLSRCEEVAAGEKISDSELLKLVSRIREIEATLGC